MTAEEQSGGIYLNVVPLLNDMWIDLLRRLSENDTRAGYLTTFEHTLSSAMAGHSLFEDEHYGEFLRGDDEKPGHDEIPDDPYAILTNKEFRGWLTVYEMIMRDHGIIREFSNIDAGGGIGISESMGWG